MEEASNSISSSGQPVSISTARAIEGDHLCPGQGLATLLPPGEKLDHDDHPSSKEERKTVAGNLGSGAKPLSCFQNKAKCSPSAVGEGMQETASGFVLVAGKEGGGFNGAANGKGKEKSRRFDVGKTRASDRIGKPGGIPNGKAKIETTGFEVLGAGAAKLCEKSGYGGEAVGIGAEKKHRAVGADLSCSLEIELIDDTAVIGLSKIDAKKEKNPRRKARSAKKDPQGNKKRSNLKVSAANSNKGKERKAKLAYSRKDMVDLRYLNLKWQRKFWQRIYNAFSPSVRAEYDELGSFSFRSHRSPGILGVAAAKGGGNCMDFYGEGGNYLDLYRHGGHCLNCMNFYVYRGFTSS